ncbi:hypothetical protein [Halalkalibacter nanhaiisediminis]|uniref:hypothetical protein n=1 Tax=Halalkalibacter nanhaiisediminis TaxID=688079 RepID=UPI00131519E7|nr:hypothetical protein [Halalkalibacter nanhaiisediminis]
MNYKNKSLEKTFEIIEALSNSPLSATNLSKQLGINRSTYQTVAGVSLRFEIKLLIT